MCVCFLLLQNNVSPRTAKNLCNDNDDESMMEYTKKKCGVLPFKTKFKGGTAKVITTCARQYAASHKIEEIMRETFRVCEHLLCLMIDYHLLCAYNISSFFFVDSQKISNKEKVS